MREKSQFCIAEAAALSVIRATGATDEQIADALRDAEMAQNYRRAEEALRRRLMSAAVPEGLVQAAARLMNEHHVRVVGVLESPIEHILLPWLIAVPCPRLHIKLARTALVSDDDRPRDRDTRIVPQMPIGRYRLDFAVVTRVAARTLILAVECDGREYHHMPDDAVRDRYLESFGIHTLRFPGAEITARPDHVAHHVSEAITSWLDGTASFGR